MTNIPGDTTRSPNKPSQFLLFDDELENDDGSNPNIEINHGLEINLSPKRSQPPHLQPPSSSSHLHHNNPKHINQTTFLNPNAIHQPIPQQRPNPRRPISISTTQPDLLLTPTTSNTSSSAFSPTLIPFQSGKDSQFKEIEDILRFPIESSHAYSYAHLSPNSLALRLNVLKRSLEILKDRPDLFKSIHFLDNENHLNIISSTTPPHDSSPNLSYLSTTTATNNNLTKIQSNVIEQRNPISAPPLHSFYNHSNNSSEFFNDNNKKYKIEGNNNNNNNNNKFQSNASSAALAAFFRPPMTRSGSAQSVHESSIHEFNPLPPPPTSTVLRKSSQSSISHDDIILSDDVKDIIDLLENDLDSLMNHSEIASTLHDLSLSSHDKDNLILNDQKQFKHDFIKNKLLYALSTPFIETSVMTSSLLASEAFPSSKSIPMRPSTTALNMLNNNTTPSQLPPSHTNNANSNRPFHSMTSGKRSLPQSVFTVEVESPWQVKAANDLACLMFGVSKGMIRSLTLMDLIAPQFRDFVTERLTKYIAENLDLMIRSKRSTKQTNNNNILFAGEVVAIARPGDQNYAWTSLWAKRKGNLIICMFDQIPCDAFDVVISCEKHTTNGSTSPKVSTTYTVDSILEIAGNLTNQFDLPKVKVLSDISGTLNQEISSEDIWDNNDDDSDGYSNSDDEYFASKDTNDSALINRTRYYTVQSKRGEHIPCALTSNPLQINNERHQIKLKIHSLPYIAGIFVISAQNYEILSCNNAIAKNLFGKSSEYLHNKSINELIPNFTDILNIGLNNNNDEIILVPGLVLPEHFFRKYDALLSHQRESPQISEEELFFNSQGIKGIHRDGKSLYVDVQLRASSNDTLVLWITYSRASSKSNISKELDRLSSSTSSISSLGSKSTSSTSIPKPSKKSSSSLTESELKIMLPKHSRSSTVKMSGTRLPSQLNLLPSDDSGILEFSPNSHDIARSNSVRQAKNGSFGIPVSYLSSSRVFQKVTSNDGIDPISTNTNLRVVSDTTSEYTYPTSSAGSGDGSTITAATTTEVSQYGIPASYLKFSEDEILKIEEEKLTALSTHSKQWPKEVGAKRKTKKFAEFVVIKELGEGAYGKVVLVQHKDDPLYKIILKCIDKERILVDTWVRDRRLGTIPSEIQVMAFLNSEPHPNIMRIVDFFEDRKYYYLETPIFGDPIAIDLFDFIEIKKDMTEMECQFIFKQIASSIYHLHKNGIVHRDVKDENVIVDENGIIKLIDFGSAGYTKQGPFDVFVGTIDYASPEVLRGEKYEGKPQDIWALGILLYTMIYKENPFYNVDEIMEGDLRVPYIVSEASVDLIKRILVRESSKRPTITDIVEDPWLQI